MKLRKSRNTILEIGFVVLMATFVIIPTAFLVSFLSGLDKLILGILNRK